MDEFLKVLLEQIRCKKAWKMIEQEIRCHMEDQIACNMEAGMTREEAERSAVADMGSPVEAGVALDRVHRPRLAWPVVGLMALICAGAVAVHFLISGEESISFARYSVLGFALMLLIYCVDYTVIARYAKAAALLYLLFFLLRGTQLVKGMPYYLFLGTVRVSFFALMQLYIPLYGAIVYQYYGTGYGGIVKSILWMLAPVWIAFRLPCLSLAVLLFVPMTLILSIAIGKRWFRVPEKKVLLGIWTCILVLPVVWLAAAYAFGWLEIYQVMRIRAFLTNSGDANYVTVLLREYLSGSRLWGGSGAEPAGYLPDFNSSYVIVSLTSGYGILAAAAVCCALAVLTVKIFSISFSQKNQLGMIIGCGCGMVFLLNITVNLLENIGWLPVSQTFLPFFSYGGSCTVVCYILMGIILSVYKYKNIYPKHTDTKLQRIKIGTDL